MQFITKDIDFGAPAVRKKVYKVYVSYRGDGRTVTINYGTNEDNDTHAGQFYVLSSEADGSTSGSGATNTPLAFTGSSASVPGTDDWIRAELKPSSIINNIYSFQLKFDGTSASDFEINDITIIYKMKSAK